MTKGLTLRVAGAATAIALATYLAFACTSSAPPGIGGPPFPFSGPSCSGTNFDQTCWDCVDVEGGPAACVTSQCDAYFTCFCACAATDTVCQGACAVSATCRSCLDTLVVFEQQSCTVLCRGGVIPDAGTAAEAGADGSGIDGAIDGGDTGTADVAGEGATDTGVEASSESGAEAGVDGGADGSVDGGTEGEGGSDAGSD